jgi:hypothetical protein
MPPEPGAGEIGAGLASIRLRSLLRQRRESTSIRDNMRAGFQPGVPLRALEASAKSNLKAATTAATGGME